MLTLSVIIVNTNTRELVCQCLESLYANAPTCEFEVIVVDNASTDGSCQAILARYPNVRLIQNDHNLGFSSANNRAFEVSRGKHKLLLNSDTIVLPKSLDLLLHALDNDKTVGIVAPKLIYPDGSLQMSYGPMPSLFVSLCSFFEIKRWISRRFFDLIGGLAAKKILGRTIESYSQWFSGQTPATGKLDRRDLITGACMLIREECFKQVGPLDPAFFIAVDDADYCKRVYDAKWQIQYLAEATIVHIKGGTMGERYRWTSPAAYYSVFHFLRKHRGRGVALTAKMMALSSLILRFIATSVVAGHTAQESWKLLIEVARWPAKSHRQSISGAMPLRREHGHPAD